MVRLRAVIDWGALLSRPVVVIPAADHLFSSKLHILKAVIADHLVLLA